MFNSEIRSLFQRKKRENRFSLLTISLLARLFRFLLAIFARLH